MGKFSVLAIDLYHPRCWTSITEKYKVSIKLLSQNFMDNHLFSSKIIILGIDSRNLIKELKSNYNIKITAVNHLSKDSLIVDFMYPKHNSISNLLHETNCLIISHRITDGIEKWRIVTDSSLQIIDKLEKLSNLVSFKELELEKVAKSIEKLTDKNMRILRIAYEKGIFNYPRNSKLSEISKEIGIKPSTLLYHIRKSEKVLLEILLDEYYSLL
ncbi:MAG: helix-turn-helix domain-containing protein [Sulfolobales archaeon]